MNGEHIFMLSIGAMLIVTIGLVLLSKNRFRINFAVLDLLKNRIAAQPRATRVMESARTSGDPDDLGEAESRAELARLQELVEDQKQIARDTDIAYHLWGLYRSLQQHADPKSGAHFVQDGEWYDVNILQVSTANGLNKYDIELKGSRYTFVDDEEQQAWRVNLKYFTLFLYDESGRCLIEIPMKTSVDGMVRRYSIAAGGPKAFLSGSWINDFIYVKLKQQRLRNQEIREQKHQERLAEIEELKEKFGISD